MPWYMTPSRSVSHQTVVTQSSRRARRDESNWPVLAGFVVDDNRLSSMRNGGV
jgi:hypothetical protein